MKKALSLILALAMALSLAACGGGKTARLPLTAILPLIIPPQNPPSCP